MDAAYEKRVGQRIRNIREKRGITQELLSAKMQLAGCDITRSALAKIEVGQRHLYIDEFKLLADLLNVDYAEFLKE